MFKGDLLEFLQRIIDDRTRYRMIYTGKVFSVDDPDKKGRIQVTIPALGWDEPAKAIWVYSSDKNSQTLPKKDDFVRVGFTAGRIDDPFFFGVDNYFLKMFPKEFDNDADTHVIWENPADDTYLTYKAKEKTLTLKDSHGNELIFNSDGVKITDKNTNKMEMTSSGIKLTDKNTNTIEMTTAEVKINGTNFEVLI